MNLRRGLLRLWVVLSIGWIAYVGVGAINYYYGSEVWASLERSIPTRFIEWALVPPVAVLIVGAALGWAIAGFREEY